MSAWLLAGLLYLGSGVGLGVLMLIRHLSHGSSQEARLAGRDWQWLGLAILFGGVLAPVLLMFGLTQTSASTASLLLNLEVVLTAVVAWFLFKEQFDRRIAAGMLSIFAGALVLAWDGTPDYLGLTGPLAIAAACLGWAFDNNLTRKVSLSDPLTIAMLKGAVAGTVNVLMASFMGARLPPISGVLLAGTVGFLGYGISLALFVAALRHIGAARTGAYFAFAPFAGALIGLLFLDDPLTPQVIAAGLLMGFGVWLHLTENHEHKHVHVPMVHDHRHVHDEHHQHQHTEKIRQEAHSHPHRHARLCHKHQHFPDAQHLHEH